MRYFDGSHSEDYRRHISNIAYRFGFTVKEQDGSIFKIENSVKTVVLTEGEVHPCKIWWKAWVRLADEYGYSGIWKDRDP